MAHTKCNGSTATNTPVVKSVLLKDDRGSIPFHKVYPGDVLKPLGAPIAVRGKRLLKDWAPGGGGSIDWEEGGSGCVEFES